MPKIPSDAIQRRFERWLLQRPEVYPLFVEECLKLYKKWPEDVSADHACHNVRRRVNSKARRGTAYFKIPNDYTSRLARKACLEYPEFCKAFDIRPLRSELLLRKAKVN
jgi:hypothetical protein